MSKRLQLDDHENMLLVTWLRTGAWLLPAVADRLCFDEFCVSLPESLSGPWSTGLAGATWESSLDGDMLSEEGRRARLSGGQLGEGVGEESARDLIALKVRLASGRLWAYVMVSTTAWVPKGICLPYGDSEWWELLDWHQWAFERGAQVRPCRRTASCSLPAKMPLPVSSHQLGTYRAREFLTYVLLS